MKRNKDHAGHDCKIIVGVNFEKKFKMIFNVINRLLHYWRDLFIAHKKNARIESYSDIFPLYILS